MSKIELLINKPLRGYKQGAVILIDVYDNSDLPKDIYWQERLKDAETDNCVSVVNKKNIKSEEKEHPKKSLKLKETTNDG